MAWSRRKQTELSRADLVQIQALEHEQHLATIQKVVIPKRHHRSCRVISHQSNWIHSLSVSENYTPILIRTPQEDDCRHRVVCITASSGPSMLIFDIETGKKLYEFLGHKSAVFAVQISQPLPQSQTLPVVVSGSQDGLMKVWDLQTGNEIHTIGSSHHTGPVKALYVYEGLNPQLYSATNKTIWIWLLESGDLIRSLEVPHPILALHAHRSHEAFRDELNPAVLVVSTSQGTIHSWHLDSSEPSFDYLGHHGPVHALTSLSTDHLKMLFSGGFDGNVKLWNLVTGAPLYSICDPLHQSPVFCFDLLRTPRVGLVVGYGDGTLSVVNITTGMKLFELHGHQEAIKSLACTVHPRPFIISASMDSTVKIWDLWTAAEEEVVEMGTSFIRDGLVDGLRFLHESKEKQPMPLVEGEEEESDSGEDER
jgi:WD40 repeat protein